MSPRTDCGTRKTRTSKQKVQYTVRLVGNRVRPGQEVYVHPPPSFDRKSVKASECRNSAKTGNS